MAKQEIHLGSRKSIIINLLILLIIFGVLVFFIFFSNRNYQLDVTLSDFRLRWLWVALALMGIYIGGEVAALMIAIKMSKGKSRLREVIAVAAIGQFYGNVTPLAVGAQPAQIYYLSRFGIPPGKSGFALLSKFVIYQIVLSIFAVAVLLLRFEYFATAYGSVTLIAVPAFALHFLIVIAILSITISKNFTKKIAFLCIAIGGKITHKIEVDQLRTKASEQIDLFSDSTKQLRQHWGAIIGIGITTAIQLTAFYFIPACIILALQLPISDLITVFAAAAFVIMIQTAMPLPGGSGAAEGGFAAFFALLFPNSVSILLALLLWRAITLLLPIILGAPFLFLVEHMIHTNKELRK